MKKLKIIDDLFYGLNTENGKLEQLIPYDFQLKLIDSVIKNRFNVIESSRQMGISLTISHFLANQALDVESNEMNTFMVSNNTECAKCNLDRIRTIINNRFKDEKNFRIYKKNTQSEIILFNNKKIKCVSIGSLFYERDKNKSIIFIDNAGYVSNLECEVIKLIKEKDSGFSKIIISSTNRFFTNDFKNNFLKHIEHKDFKHNIINWAEHPNRDQAWYENQSKIMTQDCIKTEIDCEFVPIKKVDRVLNVRLSEEMFVKLSNKCAMENRNVSDYVREIINKNL